MKKIAGIQKYVKRYEDDRVSQRDDCPLTLDDHLEHCNDLYAQFLYRSDMPYDSYRVSRILTDDKEKPLEIRVADTVRHWTRFLEPYYYLLYFNLPEEYWEAVNNAQYQYARQSLIDQCAFGFDYDIRPVLEALAANDFSVLDCNAPDALSEHCWLPWTASGNLLLGLYHHDLPTIEKGIAEAEEVLVRKTLSSWGKALAGYMLALARHDIPQASYCLNEVCSGYGRLDLSPSIQKMFCSPGHGLYNFARRILPAGEFAALAMPAHDSFIREFAVWQQEHGCPCGRVAFVYPEPFRFYNEILQLPVIPNLVGSTNKKMQLGKAWIEKFGKGVVS